MSLELPSQSVLLYKGRWTSRIDDLLISTALRFKCDHPWSGTDVPNTVVEEACAAVLKELGVKFTQLDISYRYLLLEQRYLIFKQVIAWSGATWVPNVKLVVATDCLWKDIFKVHPFATAYYHRDEPEYFRLGVLFGWDAGKAEAMHDTIVIADSVVDGQVPDMVNENLVNNDGKVNSSVGRENRPVCRQLFSDDVICIDRESTNMPRKYQHGTAPDVGPSMRAGNPGLRRPILGTPFANYSPGLSSTASSSPFRGNPNSLP